MSVYVYINPYIHIIYSLLKRFKAIMLYIKLAIICKVKQVLLKFCEHIRQVLIIKAITRLSMPSVAHLSWLRLQTQEFHSKR